MPTGQDGDDKPEKSTNKTEPKPETKEKDKSK